MWVVRLKAFFQVVDDTPHDAPDIGAALTLLTKTTVMVGVPDSNADTGRKPGTANNAMLAAVHNDGSPIRNIPARPTLLPGIADAQEAIAKELEKGATAALDGDVDRVRVAYERAGTIALVAVKKRITSNTPPPLSASTLAARRRRGVTRTNTLVDTGALLNAHTYVVETADK